MKTITMKKISVLLVLFVLFACRKDKNDTTEPKVTKEALKSEPKDVEKDTLPDVDTNVGCSIMREGTFKYKDPDGDNVIVKISGEGVTEEHKNGKYILMSKIKWINDCEYENMLVMSTLPQFNLEPGTVMEVTIDKVEGKQIYFTATAKGKSYHNVLTKVK